MNKLASLALAFTVFGSHVSSDTLTIDWLAEDFDTCEQDPCSPPPFESAFGSFTITANFGAPITDTSAGFISSSQSFGIDYDFGYNWDFNEDISLLLVGGLDQLGVNNAAVSGADFALSVLNPFSSDPYSNGMFYRTDEGSWTSTVTIEVRATGGEDTPSPIPLPASALLLASGLGVMACRWKRNRQTS